MLFQNPRRPSRPIPQAPNLMNTIPPGVPGINAPIPPQIPNPQIIDPGIHAKVPEHLSPRQIDPGFHMEAPEHLRPRQIDPGLYGTTHGARAPITNAPRPGGLLSQIVCNMRSKRELRRGR